LLRRFHAGDREAFETFCRRHVDMAYRVALRFSGNAQDAEDAVQAVFVHFLKPEAVVPIENRAGARGWIMTLVVDACRKQARSSQRRRTREKIAVTQRPEPRETPDPELQNAVRSKLDELPDEYRLPVWMRYLERLSFREIGEALGLSEDAAEKRVSRGIDKLRGALASSGFAAVALPVVLGQLPLDTAPASLMVLLKSAAGTAGAGTAGVASAKAAAVGAGKSSTLVAGTFAKVATVAVFTSAAVAGGVLIRKEKESEPRKAAVVATVEETAGPKEAVKGNDKAPLGSLEFYPSTARPIGWRGDSTGAYPAANPPVEWYRRPKGAYNSLSASSAKPQGNGPEGTPLIMGMVREWQTAGPFPAKDFATALTDVVQPNEAELQAGVGDVGGKPWKPHTIVLTNQSQNFRRLGIDFALLYDKHKQQGWQNKASTMEPMVAYASTYVYCAEASKFLLRIDGTSVQAWLNGASVKSPKDHEGAPTVDVVQGWNRLTVKAAAGKGTWYATAQFYPLPGSPYETKNIVWMAPMPGPSWSSPIVVGQKVFVSADAGTLVCLNKADGQVLWTRSTTYYHATTAEEKAKFPDLAAKAQQLDELMPQLPAALNSGLSVDGSKADGNTAMKALIKKKVDLENSIQKEMAKDKLYRAWENDRGTSTPTPCSDGTNVYCAFYGGNKDIGANVVVAYDLDGKLLWSHFTGQTGIGEHGTHSTPVLSGNYLVYMSGATLFCYEKNTGKVAWQKKTTFGGCTGCSLVALKAGDVDTVLVPMLGIYRTSDGAHLWKADVKSDVSTPCVVDGVVYGINPGRGVSQEGAQYYAYRVTPPSGDTLKPQFLSKVSWKGMGGLDMSLLPDGSGFFGNSFIGSPLYH
jgi:RNA polymerase sigma factor (sigma-70 family)